MAQIAHAGFEFSIKYPEITKSWNEKSNYIAILSVENLDKLEKLLDKANNRGIKNVPFYEPDLDNELTAISLEPSIDSKKLTRNLKLAGK